MLYTKEIDKINYQDVIDFCNEQHRENINLDYKQDIDSSLAKTIAAMANTWGGIIIIGVEDDNSKPKLPVNGIENKKYLHEQINNIILGNIIPPLFPEIQVCPSQDNKKVLVVIKVLQSNHTPHAIKNNTKVYIRTKTSNEPEELATIDRVLWLVDKRDKSTELKNNFYKLSEDRFNKLCDQEKIAVNHVDTVMSICPLFPFDILIDYQKLRNDIANKIRVNGWNSHFPLYLYNHAEYKTTQYGSYGFSLNKDTNYAAYEELNHYGLYYYREDLCHSETDGEGNTKHHALLWSILTKIDLFFDSATNFYSEIGYWGLLEFKISLNKLNNVFFRDLPATRGYIKIDHVTYTPIDKDIEFIKTISHKELKENRVDLVIDLVKEISWAIGFHHIKPETIRKLMEENNRI